MRCHPARISTAIALAATRNRARRPTTAEGAHPPVWYRVRMGTPTPPPRKEGNGPGVEENDDEVYVSWACSGQ
eukprot:scaffold157113_cov43-Tisochrysis_lutea.AAC.1